MARKKVLTDVRRNILVYLDKYTKSHGYPPCIREIAKATFHGTTAIYYQLIWLRREGYISSASRMARTYHLTELGDATIRPTRVPKISTGNNFKEIRSKETRVTQEAIPSPGD